MANRSDNVTAGKPKIGGSIYVAPTPATLPTDATTALGSDFKCLGYVSEDGVVNKNSPESETKRAWGGDVVLNSQTSKDDQFDFTLIEALNLDVLKFIYGENHVKGTLSTGVTIEATTDEPEPYAYVIEMIMKGNILKRIVIPSATVTEIGEITYSDEDPVGYAATVTATPDESGITHYEYMKIDGSTGGE